MQSYDFSPICRPKSIYKELVAVMEAQFSPNDEILF